MRVEQVQFLKSAMKPEHYPRDRRPEIAFVGRSNVGKSTLLNALMNRKDLAKTSSTPGKTQTINFFDVNGTVYFVDLPGYGFAKVPLALKEAWNRQLAEYLRNREELRLAVVLIDSRHAPGQNDLHMLELLDEAQVPTLIVATKIDKVKAGDRKRNLDRIRQELELDEDAEVVAVSGETKSGVRELWSVIDSVLAQ